MRIAWLQAVDYEALGSMGAWLGARGHHITRISLWNGDILPAKDSFDMLIVLGGGMFPTDNLHYPWLHGGLELIRWTVLSSRYFFGICLGAQLLASAFGSPIVKGDQLEIGWHRVRLSLEGVRNPLMRGLPSEFVGFHWHQDVVSVPKDGTLLATSNSCPNQAFAIGERALGVQFHPEITTDKAQRFMSRAAPPVGGRYVQTADGIFSVNNNFTYQSKILSCILTNLIGRVEPHR